MIPSYFIHLKEFPLTISGKIDRNSLPEPENYNISLIYQPAENSIEHKIVFIWKKLLGFEKIGRNDNFFELGGQSILAIRLQSQIRKEFELDIPLKIIFEYPILKNFAISINEFKKKYKII